MGKDKLRRFAEIETFENVLQLDEGKPFKGGWSAKQFKNDQPLILELACGKGEYTVNLARLFPATNFIGLDYKGNRIWRGAKTALEDQITATVSQTKWNGQNVLSTGSICSLIGMC